jgi:hypothetical protein
MWARAQQHLRRRREELCAELQRQSYGLDPMTLLVLEEFLAIEMQTPTLFAKLENTEDVKYNKHGGKRRT